MGGICGVFGRSAAAGVGEVLGSMLRRMKHRGPRGFSAWVDPDTHGAMGHAHLGAFLPNRESAPPAFLDRGDLTIALEGCVTNQREIIARLPVPPSLESARGDIRAVVAAYQSLGSDFLASLDGPFSLALWDKPRGRLILSRDKLGEKSLYYHLDPRGETIVFASEIKSILAHPAVSAELDRDGLSLHFAFGYIPGPKTLFQGIRKLLPGEALEFDLTGGLENGPYWQLPHISDGVDDEATCVRRLRELFLQGLESYVNGAREVAVLLSGGIDSSIIVAGLRELGVPRIATFTIGFDAKAYQSNEVEDFPYARRIAERYATEHHEVAIEAGHRPGRRLLRVIEQFDDLVMTPNSYSKHLLALAVREAGFDSVLTGSAAAGACGVHRKFLDPVKRARLLKKTQDCATDEERYYKLRGRLFDIDQQAALFSRAPSMSKQDVLAALHYYIRGIKSDDFFRLFLFSNLIISSTEKSLKVLDKAGILASVALRSPYLDRALVEYSAQLPSSFDGGINYVSLKTHLKKAFEDDLPREVLERTVVGYPSYYWNNGELTEFRERVFSRKAIEENGLFDHGEVTRLLDLESHSDDRSAGKWSWALMQFSLWYEIHIKRNPEFMDGNGAGIAAP